MTTLDKYIAALKAHDWFYMYADSGLEFAKGKSEWLAIAHMRGQLDPNYEIFNQYAPPQMQIKPKDLNNA